MIQLFFYWLPHQDNWPKLFDSLTASIFVFDTPNFSSFIYFKYNSSNAFILLEYKSETISKASDSSCIIKSCLHSNSAFNLLIFSLVASINSISSSTLFFANKISKFLIGSSNFDIS